MLGKLKYPRYEPIYKCGDPDASVLFILNTETEKHGQVPVPEEVSDYAIRVRGLCHKDPISQAEAETYAVIGGIRILNVMQLIRWAARSRK